MWSYGLAVGIAARFNPLAGGLTTLGCYLLTPNYEVYADSASETQLN